jgi:hypothetical protein
MARLVVLAVWASLASNFDIWRRSGTRVSVSNVQRARVYLGQKMTLIPLELAEANAFVTKVHRHHGPVVGHKFSLGAVKDEQVVGAAIVGRPVSRMRDDGHTLEVTRLATDGTRNACSFLYGACARAVFALGYRRLGTYILASENGATLKASGWRLIGEAGGGSWSVPSRPRVDKHPLQKKLLFEKTFDG